MSLYQRRFALTSHQGRGPLPWLSGRASVQVSITTTGSTKSSLLLPLHSIWVPPKLALALLSLSKLQTVTITASAEVLTDSSKSCELALFNSSDGPHVSPQAWDHQGFGCHLCGHQKSTPTSHLVCSGNATWAQEESALTRFHFPRRLMTVACTTQGTLGGISDVGTVASSTSLPPRMC